MPSTSFITRCTVVVAVTLIVMTLSTPIPQSSTNLGAPGVNGQGSMGPASASGMPNNEMGMGAAGMNPMGSGPKNAGLASNNASNTGMSGEPMPPTSPFKGQPAPNMAGSYTRDSPTGMNMPPPRSNYTGGMKSSPMMNVTSPMPMDLPGGGSGYANENPATKNHTNNTIPRTSGSTTSAVFNELLLVGTAAISLVFV